MKTRFFFLLLFSLSLVVGAAEPIVWNFERDVAGWQPRAKSITIDRGDLGPTPECKSSLHLHGSIDSGFNYVASDRHPMQPGQLYRFSAWLRVDRFGAGTPAPYLKCEFVGSTSHKDLGRINTSTYEAKRLGVWQRLEVEFAAPKEITACWVALEKGTGDRAEIEAWLADVRIEPIARLSVLAQYELNPLPPGLVARRGVHPRLYLDAARITELRSAITTTHAPLWKELQEQADRFVKSGPPAYREQDNSSGDEQLYQREVGNAMPTLAMAWRLSGDRKYLASAQAWALAACHYATWGLGKRDGMDLAAGHQLFGLGIVYDWCYSDLDEVARTTIRETITRRGSAMFQAGLDGRAWWQKSYLQNHLWVNICGLSIAGLAVYDEVEGSERWVGFALRKFQRTMESLGPDGASHEGVGYWGYGVEYMMKFMHLSRELLGVNLYDRPWWRQTASYRLYLGLPRNAWNRRNCIVDIADCTRGNWYGPDYLLRGLAREFRDGQAQWLAAQIDEAKVADSAALWLNLVWFDPSLVPQPPTALPTLRHFEDMGLVSARSGWSGDESLAVFKCGPVIGHEATQRFDYDPGCGHVHPDANHFVLFGAGDWLIRDDGYRTKKTAQHNTLLIDGHGQLGEGAMWFKGIEALAVKARPRVLRAESTPELDQIVGDATEAYPKTTGLQRYVRHLLFVKPDLLIVADEITMDQPRSLELRFHPEHRTGPAVDGVCLGRSDKANLRLELLTRDGVELTTDDAATEGQHGKKSENMFAICMRSKQAQWRNAVALSWSSVKSEPVQVKFSGDQKLWRFTAADREVVLDWATGAAKLSRSK